jgi:hypothetical protein
MEAQKSYYALITPLDKEFTPPTMPGQPGVPHPSHPIAGIGTPEHPIVIPPNGAGPGSPTNPIWLPAYPDNALPGTPDGPVFPSHPIVFPPGLPALPTHPIALPPTDGLPPLIPTHPIVIPPDGTLPEPPEGAEGKADAVVVLLPPNRMAVPPGTAGDYVPAILWYGPGTLPVQIWVPPEAAQKYAPKEPKEPKGKKAKTAEEQDEQEAEARYRKEHQT